MKPQEKTDYEIQAEQFLFKTQTEFKGRLIGHGKHFPDDTTARDIYEITLTRKDKKPFVFVYGQSIANSFLSKDLYSDVEVCKIRSGDRKAYFTTETGLAKARKGKEPSAYDVLACLTKEDPETFEDFCSNYGYGTDSRKAETVYFAVQNEWVNVRRLFGDVLDELREIQ